MRKHKKFRTIVGLMVLSLFLLCVVSSGTTSASGLPENFLVPTDGAPVSTTAPLTEGVNYLITVSGVWSAWNRATWDAYPWCGTPVITEKGPTGVDANYIFARPGPCRPGGPPWRGGFIQIQLDYTEGWFVAVPLNTEYAENHIYQYIYEGRGKLLVSV